MMSILLSARNLNRVVAAAAAVATLCVAGCGDIKKNQASQTAAKVNKEEITVHQINFVLQRQQGLKPEQAEAASRQVLERLIDQELAMQRAEELKLDRTPMVVQQLEAARREVIARAYVAKASEAAAKPAPEEIKKYYDENPALFKERRVYNIQEISIEAETKQIDELRTQLQAAKSINEFVEYLKANDFRFGANQAVRAAEQLPLKSLDTFAKMKDGQAILAPTPKGAQVIVLAGSKSAPVDEAAARPAIEQYLLNDRRRQLVEDDMKALRATAKIEYVGKFAEPAASAPVVAPAPPPAPAPSPASDVLSDADITKGMGLK
ncbi:MAG: EpsD family peptidyl-prolyl cis-trans isomerase [Burkholderiaceae bacterium]|nr:EpsD family peptidyl-prolyl cis-trans isomerase [Burkholderiaceae bacterium]